MKFASTQNQISYYGFVNVLDVVSMVGYILGSQEYSCLTLAIQMMDL